MISFSHFPEAFPCPICGEIRDMRASKKDKPYLVCDPCGVQIFIRGKSGISRLIELKNNSELWDKIHSSTILDSCNLLKLSRRIDLIQAEIEKLDEEIPLFGSKRLETQRDKLSKRREDLESEYRKSLATPDHLLPKKGQGV